MSSILYRISASLLIVVTGCSSSGLFAGRNSKGRGSVEDAFASTGESPSSRDRSAAAQRSGSSTAGKVAALDPAERRRTVSSLLATATRADQAGDTRAARRAYERILQLEPSHSQANYQLAVIADNEARFDDAERHYQVLLRKTPQNPDLLASLGWSYLLQGRYDESERTLRDALSIDPQHRTAQYNLGWLYGTLGDYDRSLEIFRAAGSEADAQRAIAELFPNGRPEKGASSIAKAPRNPFRPSTRSVAPGSGNDGSRAPDRFGTHVVSAPAPWQTRSDAAVAGDIASREPPPVAGRKSAVPDEGAFDEVFSTLELPPAAPNVRSALPSDRAATPDARTAEFRDAEKPRVGAIETAGFDQTRPSGLSDSPIITPKGPPPNGRGAFGTDRKLLDGEPTLVDLPPAAAPSAAVASAAVPAAGEPPRKPAAPTRKLPDWPHRVGGPRKSEPEPLVTAVEQTDPRITAFLLGLSAGPGGVLFPTTAAPVDPIAGR